MKCNTRRRWIGMLSLGLIAVAAIVVVLAVFGGTNDTRFTATGYSDVIRFQAEGVATLQVRIFDLSGKEVWDSGMVSGWTVDWDRRNDTGEQLAYGAYIYSAQGWNAQGDLIFQKNGKLALMPGDKVQLQAAPLPTPVSPFNPLEDQPLTVQPKGLSDIGVFYRVGIGTDTPNCRLHIYAAWPELKLEDPGTGTAQMSFYSGGLLGGFFQYSGSTNLFRFGNYKPGGDVRLLAGGNQEWVTITATGNVGVGTTSPVAKLEIESSSGQDLIAAYNGSNRVFVVKSTGEVRADGAYYSGAGDCNTGGFNAGGADVAERINTSEWVEAGYVVEIDPEHPGFFRKSSSPYSTKVAGIISTSPGVILGNDFDATTDDWEDNRPVLAIAGRVPLQATTENGSIQIGDLLVSSSVPGVAMRGDLENAMGAVVGKAMEPLAEETGTIVVQVMLR